MEQNKHYCLKPISDPPKEDGIYQTVHTDYDLWSKSKFQKGTWFYWYEGQDQIEDQWMPFTDEDLSVADLYYLSLVPAIGAVWVKASDRVPEKEGNYCCRISGGYMGLRLIDLGNYKRFEAPGRHVVKTDTIEWLDESTSPATAIGEWVNASIGIPKDDETYFLLLDNETQKMGCFYVSESGEKFCRIWPNGAAPEFDIPENKFNGIQWYKKEKEMLSLINNESASPSSNRIAELEKEVADLKEVIEDNRVLVKELDDLFNGKERSAKQPRLCDIVAQVRKEGLLAKAECLAILDHAEKEGIIEGTTYHELHRKFKHNL